MQIFEVALSRRICCSRVCRARRKAGFPVASILSDDAVFLIEEHVHPQTKAVVITRAKPLGITVVEVDSGHVVRDGYDGEFFGALLQYPDTTGTVIDYTSFAEFAHSRDALVIAATDLLALTLLKPPGEWVKCKPAPGFNLEPTRSKPLL